MTPVRVLVVDDSVVVRRLVADVLAADPNIEVVGTAPNGKLALAKIPMLKPDLITLDIEMPIMDGLETLLELRPKYPTLPVVMFSTLTESGASATLTALERGASDYVTKPANVGSVTESKEAVRTQLIPKIHALCAGSRRLSPTTTSTLSTRVERPVAKAAPVLRAATTPRRVDILVIGSSTGGPDALTKLLSALPGDLGVPVLVVQHMPPVFTRAFADRLNTKAPLHISEAQDGDEIVPGRVLIAPGDFHLRVGGRPDRRVAVLDQGPQENFCRPAVDVMFRSVAQTYGGNVLSVVLTGMGSDGALGTVAIADSGGAVIAQDEATSVVWGMPGAVVAAGTANEVLPLPDIANAITSRCLAGRSLRAAAVLTDGARA